jgi:secondary thiamine-phosphate synthase enzyme
MDCDSAWELDPLPRATGRTSVVSREYSMSKCAVMRARSAVSRRSIVTARDQPVAGVTSISGASRAHGETFVVRSSQRVDVIDLTDRVRALVRGSGVTDGIVSVFSTHTTCAVFINEFQGALVADIKTSLERMVARDDKWLHNDPAHSDCDRMNADAHLRAMVLGHGLTLQLSGGDVVLGQWQRVLMAELDGPRERSLRLQVVGIVGTTDTDSKR